MEKSARDLIVWLQSLSTEHWRWITAAMLFVAIVLVNYKMAGYNESDMKRYRFTSMSEIAKRDLTKIGCTDWHCVASLQAWIFSILVINYRQDKTRDIMSVIRQWAVTGIDPVIAFDIEVPYTNFLKIIDDAREKKQEPVFKVSSEYDYHTLSKTLMYNDFVDCKSLLVKIDEITGVAQHG